jgi:hypothetical protein
MNLFVSHDINESQSDARGLEDGWYASSLR